MSNNAYEVIGFTCMECNKKFLSLGEKKKCKSCGMDLCGACSRKHSGLCVWCLDSIPDEKRWALALIKLMMGLSIVLGFLIPAPLPLILLLGSNPVNWGFGFMYGIIFLLLFTIMYFVVKAQAIKAIPVQSTRDANSLNLSLLTQLDKRDSRPAITSPSSRDVQVLPEPIVVHDPQNAESLVPRLTRVVQEPASIAPENVTGFMPVNNDMTNEKKLVGMPFVDVPGIATVAKDAGHHDVEFIDENEPVDGIRPRKAENGGLQARLENDGQDNIAMPTGAASTIELQPETINQEDTKSKQESLDWLEKQLMENINDNNPAPEQHTIKNSLDFEGDIDQALRGSTGPANEVAIPVPPENASRYDVPIVPADADNTGPREPSDSSRLHFGELEKSLSSIQIESKQQAVNFFCSNCRNHFQGTQNRINICPFCGFPVKS
ncbi:MAG TPA: hypothetical protein VKM55_11965 [Candidatus Lokiarchaeia archaeon]|nr:hypothetical protein [Candidatus Lokiarchaeia archaeon]